MAIFSDHFLNVFRDFLCSNIEGSYTLQAKGFLCESCGHGITKLGIGLVFGRQPRVWGLRPMTRSMFQEMTTRPDALSSRIRSGNNCSRCAACTIASVLSPLRVAMF